MTHLAYLGALAFSIAGLGVLDWHRRLAVFADARRALVAVAIAVVFFLTWDAAGIALGIFWRGDAPYMTGVEIAPEVPIEEPVFLVLLSYVTLLIWRLAATRGGQPRPLGARPASQRRATPGAAR